MKDTKTVWHSFIPWQYDMETAELDDMSERGWQLQRLGQYRRTYVRDDSVRYRYALDLQKENPRPDYFGLFRDQGWEQVCACRNSDGGGAEGWWYVFRKAYDPALPEEEYRIYTDRPSLEEMKGRWSAYTWSWVALLAVWGAIFVLQPSMSRFLLVLWWLAMLLLWTARRRSLRRADRGAPRRRRRRFLPDIAISVLFLAVYAAVTYVSFRTGATFGYDGLAADAPPAMELTVKVPDWYTLTAFAYDAGGEAAGEFTLTDSRDRVKAGGALEEDRPLRENEHELFLWPGQYTLTTGAAPEGEDDSSIYYSLSAGWQHSLFRRR